MLPKYLDPLLVHRASTQVRAQIQGASLPLTDTDLGLSDLPKLMLSYSGSKFVSGFICSSVRV